MFWNASTAMDGLSGSARAGFDFWRNRRFRFLRARKPRTLARSASSSRDLALVVEHTLIRSRPYRNSTKRSKCLPAPRMLSSPLHVSAIAEDIVVVDDDVLPDGDADAELRSAWAWGSPFFFVPMPPELPTAHRAHRRHWHFRPASVARGP